MALPVLITAVTLSACGGNASEEKASADETQQSAQAPGPGGGMFAELTDEQTACLEEQGVTLPERPEGSTGEMPEGDPPEGMPEGGPPEGMPEGGPQSGDRPEGMPEGMEEMQQAMEQCGIDMPEPPDQPSTEESVDTQSS